MKRLIPLAALALTACAVGPNYVRPASAPNTERPFVDPGAAMPAVASATPPGPAWWRLFDDLALDRLIGDALAHNTDIRVAVANVASARATLSEARGALLPSTTLSAGVQRQRVGTGASGARFGGAIGGVTGGPSHYDFTLYSGGFDASYEVDLFGRVRRSIEAARADYRAAEADLDAARVAIVAEVARNYASACGSAEQAEVARETATLQNRTLDLTRRLYQAGRGTRREIDQAQVLAENARAQVPGFEAERRAAIYALATLTGRPPAEFDPAAAACVRAPRVAVAIPIGDGAGLLARRPDVRAAERRLAGETARIGVATAALFPQISIGGSASTAGTRAGDLTKPSAFGFAIGPLLSWSFPNISAARARISAARAATQAALARFDGTVLTALRETEQALARYSGALERQARLGAAARAAEDAATLSRTRFDAGRDSFLQLLDAERDRASSRATLAQSDAAVASAQVDLFNALGGGWEGARATP